MPAASLVSVGSGAGTVSISSFDSRQWVRDNSQYGCSTARWEEMGSPTRVGGHRETSDNQQTGTGNRELPQSARGVPEGGLAAGDRVHMGGGGRKDLYQPRRDRRSRHGDVRDLRPVLRRDHDDPGGPAR